MISIAQHIVNQSGGSIELAESLAYEDATNYAHNMSQDEYAFFDGSRLVVGPFGMSVYRVTPRSYTGEDIG